MARLLLLCWKSLLVLRRRWYNTLFVVFLPGLVCLSLLFIRSKTPKSEVTHVSSWANFTVDRLPPLYTTLVYAPNCTHSEAIATRASQSLGLTSSAFSDERELEDFLADKTEGFAGVVFHNCSALQHISYSIRIHSMLSWQTTLLFCRFPIPGPRANWSAYAEPPNYVESGFLALQQAMDKAIINYTVDEFNTSLPFDVNVLFKRLPYPPYLEDAFTLVVEQQLAILIVIGFLFPVVSLMKRILEEKSTRIKESIRMMGVSSMAYWTSWFLTFALLFVLSSAIVTGALCIDFDGGGGGVSRMLTRSSSSLVFCSLCLYAFALISFIFALSTIFMSPNGGAAITSAILVLTFIPYQLMLLHYENYGLASKLACCLIPNMAVGFLCFLIGHFEGVGSGAQWSLFFQQASSDDALRFDLIWSVLFFDCLFYLFLAWYIDNIHPGTYGVPEPWYFPVEGLIRYRPAFLGGGRGAVLMGPLRVDASSLSEPSTPNPLINQSFASFEETNQNASDPSSRSQSDAGFPTTTGGIVSLNPHQQAFEAPPVGLSAGITMHNLYKTYGTAKRVSPAVANVTMSVYEGQITILLGQNGAGKTTLMSMLTGLLKPTSGAAFVNGHSVATDMGVVRKSLGFCPQHNLLLGNLTVSEHLWLFARLKGCHPEDTGAQVGATLRQVHLRQKANAFAHTLSGGAKRRLSLGMALIGNSKVVILDEPTSGLDPSARRQIWDILMQERPYRTILVSTHYMDEAEYLGDRIAILSAGKLRCVGSPFFLKHLYGTGYTLTLLLNPDTCPETVVETIREFILPAKQQSCDGTELKVHLPVDAVHAFAGLFSRLETQKLSMGIASFGVSVTTMEEVFFRVATQVDAPAPTASKKRRRPSPSLSRFEPTNSYSDFDDYSNSASHNSRVSELRNTPTNRGCLLFFQQLFALTQKRYLYSKRMPLLTLGQLLIPLLCALMAHMVYRDIFNQDLRTQPPLRLSLSSFKPGGQSKLVIPVAGDATGSQLLSAYAKQFDPAHTSLSVITNASAFEGFVLGTALSDIHQYVTRYIIGLVVSSPANDSSVSALAYFMGESLHALPAALNALSNGILRLLVSQRSGLSTNFSIETFNHPLGISAKEMQGELMAQSTWTNVVVSGVTIGIDTLAGVAFLAASFSLTLIHERSSHAKHLQFISGAHLSTYWLAMFVWDGLTYTVSASIVFLVFGLFNLDPFSHSGRLWLVGLLLTAYGWSMIPLVYFLSVFYSSPASGLVWLGAFNILSGVIGTVVVQALCLPPIGLQWLALRLRVALIALSPSFALCDGLFAVNANYEYSRLCSSPVIEFICADPQLMKMPCCPKTCDPFCAYPTSNYLSMDAGGIGQHLFTMALQGLIFSVVVIFSDTTLAHRLWLWAKSGMRLPPCCCCPGAGSSGGRRPAISPQERLDDEDVARHRDQVHSMSPEQLKRDTCLTLIDVTKVYGQRSSSPVVALDSCTLAITPGECFGLLGVNGAGKTTLFEIVTGNSDATEGQVLVNGQDVLTQRKKAQKSIGYCPQFDALLDYLTCRETLVLFGRLRGLHYTDSNADQQISSLLAALQLTDYAYLLVRHLSGGKRRRLSLATALLGAPPLLCLDEPTAGVDPLSKRLIWNLLNGYRKAGTTILISTHSTDECEALCTRMGMLVNGRFKCLGSCQHLKSRFGEGYSISLQVGASPLISHKPMDDSHHNRSCLSCVSSIGGRESSFATADDTWLEEERIAESAALETQIQRVIRFFETEFPHIRLLDQHSGVLQFHVMDESTSLSRIFGLIECYKVDLGISTYYVSQTQLEQIFVSLARQQHDPEAPLIDVNSWKIGEQVKRSLISCCKNSFDRKCCCRRQISRQVHVNNEEVFDALSDDGSATMLM